MKFVEHLKPKLFINKVSDTEILPTEYKKCSLSFNTVAFCSKL